MQKFCCTIPIIVPKADEDAGRYDAYQGLLTNMMTIGTLLLGFIITGTLLSVSLTGDENFDSNDLIDFLKLAGASGVCATSTVIISLILSMHATEAYANQGPSVGLRVMRFSALKSMVAEMLLYVSLLFFFISLKKFIGMVDMGPDICPASAFADVDRPQAFCSSTGLDLYEAAKGVCGNLTVPAAQRTEFPEVCEYLDGYDFNLFHQTYEQGQLRFLWQGDRTEYHRYGFYSALRTKMLDDISNVICRTQQQENIMKAICVEAGKLTVGCTQATQAWLVSDNCAGGKVDDANKCFKVCAWSAKAGGVQPKKKIRALLDGIKVPACLIVGLLVLVRLWQKILQVRAIMARYNVGLLPLISSPSERKLEGGGNQGKDIHEDSDSGTDEP